jgi:limonene-1,2-epoxide hydrolase
MADDRRKSLSDEGARASLSPRALRIIEALESIQHGVAQVDRAAEVYEDDVVFRDPIHTCRGKAALRAMTRRYVEGAREIGFEIDRSSVVESDGSMYFTWIGTFAARIGPTVRVEGATHLRLRGERIADHRDYFDVLGAVVSSLPGVAMARRWLTGARE